MLLLNTKLFSPDGVFLTNAMSISPQRNNQIKTHYDDTKKRAHDSQIVRVKENLKLSYGRASPRQASVTNQRIKALRQGRHCVYRRANKAETIAINCDWVILVNRVNKYQNI